jgi:putative glutamine amidotransferase
LSCSRPVIGITADVKSTDGDPRTAYDLRVKGNYAQAIAGAGGIPILVPPEADAEDIMGVIDGLLIPGGDDIDSVHWGAELHPRALLQDPLRFEAESALYRAAPKELPVLGICYGCQFINVMQGGTLIQHLPDIHGSMTHTGGELQSYELESETKVAQAIGSTRASGKSYHHQAVETPGTDVRVTGQADDGTVEAIEVTSRDWTVAVQWHPERTLDDQGMKNLFKALVDEASAYRAKRLEQPPGV